MHPLQPSAENIQRLPLASDAAVEMFIHKAVALVPPGEWHYTCSEIAGTTLRLCTAGERLRAWMSEAIRHLNADADVGEDLTIYAIDEQAMGISAPDAPWRWHLADREGYLHGLNTQRFTANFDINTQVLRLLDREGHVALLWIRDLTRVPSWERSFPLRQILHWWFRDTQLQPMHAACVGIDGKGVLIGAKGGSGKSSTALACLCAGMQFIGDDFVLVDVAAQMAYSMYSIAKLDPTALARFPQLQPVAGPTTVEQDKHHILLSRVFPERLQRSMTLRMVLIPHLTYQPRTFISPIGKQEAASALILSTLFLLKGDNKPTVRKITDLVNALPAYQLNLGTDFEEIPTVLARTIEDHGNGA